MSASRGPIRIDVSVATAHESAELSALIDDTRARAGAFVFLSGGASKMAAEDQRRLLGVFGALADLAASGRSFAVGDGGTQAGIMQAAGEARQASGGTFPLIGVCPTREIEPLGATPVDPNHSAIIAVDDPALPAGQDGWGSEIPTMYEVFARLAHDRPSVTVVANGGGLTLDEVRANLRARRPMILVEGSGRAADALVSLVRGTSPLDEEGAALRARAEAALLHGRPDLFTIVHLDAGARGLLDALAAVIDAQE